MGSAPRQPQSLPDVTIHHSSNCLLDPNKLPSSSKPSHKHHSPVIMHSGECVFTVNHQPAQVYTLSQSDQQSILDFVTTPYHGAGDIMVIDSQPPQQYTFSQHEQESVIDITQGPISIHESLHMAEGIYYHIIDDCEKAGVSFLLSNVDSTATDAGAANEGEMLHQTHILSNHCSRVPGEPFNVSTTTNTTNGNQGLHMFFRCLYGLCPEGSRTDILKLVLLALFIGGGKDRAVALQPLSCVLHLARVWHRYTIGEKHKGYKILQTLAKDILTGFFIPSCTKREHTKPPHSILATPLSRTGACYNNARRCWSLAALCFDRDGARFVIMGKYHRDWALGRPQQSSIYGLTETGIAYIIPHTLNDMEPDGRMCRTNSFIWKMMDMLDHGLGTQLEAYKITTPMNALLMDKALCDSFAELQWYLQGVPNTVNTYTLHTFTRYRLNIQLPFQQITFTNHEEPTSRITPSDLPCLRLLRFHRLCCLILNTSDAAQFVEHALENARLMEQGVLPADKKSNLDLLISWWG